MQEEILKALVYYGSIQSYLDPLGRPCACVSCDKGSRATACLEKLNAYKGDFPEDYPMKVVRPVLEFYATGAGYGNQSSEYGDAGYLARYAIRCIWPSRAELEMAIDNRPWLLVKDLYEEDYFYHPDKPVSDQSIFYPKVFERSADYPFMEDTLSVSKDMLECLAELAGCYLEDTYSEGEMPLEDQKRVQASWGMVHEARKLIENNQHGSF